MGDNGTRTRWNRMENRWNEIRKSTGGMEWLTLSYVRALLWEKAGVFSSSLSTASRRPNSILGSCWLFCRIRQCYPPQTPPTLPHPFPSRLHLHFPNLLLLNEDVESFIKHPVQTSRQEMEDAHLPVRTHHYKLLATRREGQAEGSGLCLGGKGFKVR